MIKSSFINSIYVFFYKSWLGWYVLGVLLINFSFNLLLGLSVKMEFDEKNIFTEFNTLSFSLSYKEILFSQVLILILPFFMEYFENTAKGKTRFLLLPINFWDLYWGRLIITFLFYTIFWILSAFSFWIICILRPLNLAFWSENYISFFQKSFLGGLGYMFLATLLSFFIKNIYFSIALIVVGLLLTFTKSFLLPFSLSIAAISLYQRAISINESINIDLSSQYLWASFFWVIFAVLLIFSFQKVFFKWTLNNK